MVCTDWEQTGSVPPPHTSHIPPPAAVPTSPVLPAARHPGVSRAWVMLRGWKEDFSLDEHG